MLPKADAFAQQGGIAPGFADVAQQSPYQGAFARAVGADEAKHVALIHGQINIPYAAPVFVNLGKRFCFNGCHSIHPFLFRLASRHYTTPAQCLQSP
jgi:hypothetical protein